MNCYILRRHYDIYFSVADGDVGGEGVAEVAVTLNCGVAFASD